jgi:putative ABC transport system permease protein
MNDLRYALRQLGRNPLFAIVAIATLGLGIGMNTAIFSAAKTSLRPELPFENPDRLVRVYQVPEGGSPDISPRAPAFMLVRDNIDAFESIAGFRFTDFTLTTPEGPERLIGGVITPGWLSTLGVRPRFGRGLSPDEEATGRGSQVALMSHALAQREFGAAADAVGRTLRLNGIPHDVVGVLPEGFTYPYDAQVWVPFRPESEDQGSIWALNIQARISATASLGTAEQELRLLSDRMAGITPELTEGMTLVARPLRQTLVDEEGRTVTALLAAVGFLLLVACANLANLLLSRALARESEFAVRSSLGASRLRLGRQSLTESLVLGVAGCLAGVALAWFGVGFIEPLIPSRLFTLGVGTAIDLPTLGFAISLSLLTAMILGLVPALRASATRPATAMRHGRRSAGGRRSRSVGRWFVVAELALTLMLLTGVGLMARDLQRLQSLELGYDPADLLLFNLAIVEAPYDTGERRVQFVERLIDELNATPGVEAAGVTSMFPRHRGNNVAEVEGEGHEAQRPGLTINNRYVVPGFLETLGTPLLRGRWLTSSDRAGGPPVALVSASLAEALWPGEDPLGRWIRNRRVGDQAEWHTVVGVVGDVRQADDIRHTWYLSYSQHAGERPAAQVTVVARGTEGAGAPPLQAVRRALLRVDSELPVFEAVTAETLNYEALARERHGTRLGGLFAVFGLLLATLGMYGAISYSVNRRVREFGIRMALGSDNRRILRSVLLEVGRLMLIGGALGLAGSLALARFLGATLSQIGPFDPVAFTVAGLLLSLTALAAGAVPAWRAARIDPVRALRAE